MEYAGITFSDYHIRLVDIVDSVTPDLSYRAYTRLSGMGSYVAGREVGYRSLTLFCRLRAGSKTELYQRMSSFAGALAQATDGFREEKELVLPDSPVYYKARLISQSPLIRVGTSGNFDLDFICYDPLGYGDLKSYDLSDASAKEVENEGSVATQGRIEIEIDGTPAYLIVTQVETGQYVRVDRDFANEDLVVIDLEKETITKNEESIMADCYLQSDFFEIPIGKSSYEISNGSGTLVFSERFF